MIGQTLGSYTIERELGRGGMGAVYVGVHAMLGRRAAVKVLLPEFSKNQGIVQRFFNEAKAATTIKHPGIVDIYDFGYATIGGETQAYIVMEMLEGEPLSARLARVGRMSVPGALGVARQMAGALAAAHRIGIIHRDLKPDNVFLVPDPEVASGERIKLLDFGIAKLAHDPSSGEAMARTRTGVIMGTPSYMSPEQCRGASQMDGRSDLYAIGCILFEMLCGRVPFVGEGAGEIIAAHIHVPPPSPTSMAPALPPAVDALLLRLLAKPPEGRPASADVLIEELAALGVTTLSTDPGVVARGPAASTIVATPTTLGAAAGQRATADAPRSRRGLVAVIAALVVAGAGVTVFALTRGSTAASRPPVDARVAVAALDAGLQGDLATEAARLLADARRAVDAEDWDTASRAARGALALEPDSLEAQELVDQADLEGPAAGLASSVEAAAAAGDFEAAIEAFEDIPPGSRYQRRAATTIDGLRERYLAEIGPKIDALVAQHRCAEAAHLADEAAELWPKRTVALEQAVAACKRAKPAPQPPPPPKPDAGVPSAPAKTELTAKDIRTVLQAVARKAKDCGDGTSGTVKVKLTIAPSGSVTKAQARGELAGTPAAACVIALLERATFPAWSGAPMSISHSFELAD